MNLKRFFDAFSRCIRNPSPSRNLLLQHDQKCLMIYGSMPPETQLWQGMHPDEPRSNPNRNRNRFRTEFLGLVSKGGRL